MYQMHHICIQTDKYGESLRFYTEILGFEVIEESENFHKRAYNTWLGHGDIKIELQTHKDDDDVYEFNKQANGIVHFCLLTDDLDVAYKTLLSKGFNRFRAKNGQDIYTVKGGRLMKIVAPEGTIIELRDTK